jgi:uncharacterized protein YjbI with pentapeptide repeats
MSATGPRQEISAPSEGDRDVPEAPQGLRARWNSLVEREAAAYLSLSPFTRADEIKLAIDALAETTKHARSVFIVQLGVAGYSILTLAGIADADFYGPSSAVRLPLLAVDVSPAVFFLAAPALVLVVSLYLQIYLGHLGRLSRRLSSAKIGTLVDRDLLYPWLGTLDRGDAATGRIVGLVYLALVWWTAPFVTLLYWLRLLPLRATLWDWARGNGLPPANLVGWLWILSCGSAAAVAHLRRAVAARLDDRLPRRAWLMTAMTWSVTGLALLLVVFSWHLVLPFTRPVRLAGANLSAGDRTAHANKERAPTGALLRGVRLNQADMRNVVFNLADLRGSQIEGANLNGAELRFADFSPLGCMGSEDEFQTARKRACLELHPRGNALLRGTLFRHADLRGADLSGADLTGANFQGAHLEGADLSFATLRHVVFDDAHLEGANLDKADLTGSRMFAVHLEAAVLSRTRLCGAQIATTALRGVVLEGVDARPCDVGPENAPTSQGWQYFSKGKYATPVAYDQLIERSGCDWRAEPVRRSICFANARLVLGELLHTRESMKILLEHPPEWLNVELLDAAEPVAGGPPEAIDAGTISVGDSGTGVGSNDGSDASIHAEVNEDVGAGVDATSVE